MSTKYSIVITMSQTTVDSLSAGGFSLFGFKAVKATTNGGPLVWFQTGDYDTTTPIGWEETYEAYVSNTEIDTGVTIDASNSLPINLGQTLDVNDPKGTGVVKDGGLSEGISILNDTSAPFTCGISQTQGGTTTPLCAFPLFGNGLDVIVPIEKVLLTFASSPIDTGTVIEQAFAQGFLIDLTDAPSQSRAVNFDINKGWSNGGFTWAQVVPPQSSLLPLLIDNSVSTVRALKAA